MSDSFWLDNTRLLIDRRKLYDFLPTVRMTLNEKLNSIVRLSLYFSFILSVLTNNINYIFIFLIACFITYIIYVFKEPNNEN